MATIELAADGPNARGVDRTGRPWRPGPMLAAWIASMIVLQGLLWTSGARSVALAVAVESGSAVAETRALGELPDDLIRKAIRTQQDTRPFWTALTMLGDLVAEPLALAVRAVVVATLLSGLAALAGRPIEFGRALAGSVAAQGFWVLGLAVKVALIYATGHPAPETSLTLLLGPGSHPAPVWVALEQVDAFAVLGWLALARGGWSRGQVRPIVALLVCGVLALIEAATRIVAVLVLGAGMRLTLIPDWLLR